MRVWTLEDALQLVRGIQPEVFKFGYHVALGGSVLNAGRSEKDLDLYFHPSLREERQGKKMIDWLQSSWGPAQSLDHDYQPRQPEPTVPLNEMTLAQYKVYKMGGKSPSGTSLRDLYDWALKFNRAGDRIDIFVTRDFGFDQTVKQANSISSSLGHATSVETYWTPSPSGIVSSSQQIRATFGNTLPGTPTRRGPTPFATPRRPSNPSAVQMPNWFPAPEQANFLQAPPATSWDIETTQTPDFIDEPPDDDPNT